MKKALSELTLEELWELFPIFLVQPNKQWADYYEEMKDFLYHILSDYQIQRISHIESTAIKGIRAKTGTAIQRLSPIL